MDGPDDAMDEWPRCPLLLVIDTSRAMAGEKIASVNAALPRLLDAIRGDTRRSKDVDVALLASSATTALAAFRPAASFEAPNLEAGGEGFLAESIRLALTLIEESQASPTRRPCLLIIAGGGPPDNEGWREAADSVRFLEDIGGLSVVAIDLSAAGRPALPVYSRRSPAETVEAGIDAILLQVDVSLAGRQVPPGASFERPEGRAAQAPATREVRGAPSPRFAASRPPRRRTASGGIGGAPPSQPAERGGGTGYDVLSVGGLLALAAARALEDDGPAPAMFAAAAPPRSAPRPAARLPDRAPSSFDSDIAGFPVRKWKDVPTRRSFGPLLMIRTMIRFALAMAALAAAVYAARHELAGAAGWFTALFRGASVPLPGAARPATVVDVSAYSPSQVAPGTRFLVQVLVHDTDEKRSAIDALARERDPGVKRRGVTTLEVEIARGDRLDITLDAPGLTVEDAWECVVWRGKPLVCTFALSVPDDVSVIKVMLGIRVYRQAVPVGRLAFSITVAPEAAAAPFAAAGEASRRYRRAFLSYASSDRPEVVKRAQALRAGRVEFFADVLSLEPGQQWEPRLYAEIENCDLFILFWSQAASRSEWVGKEIAHALACRARLGDDRPEILPILIEGPPPEPPPLSLRDIHFNDPFLYMIAAADRLARKRPPAR